MSIVFHKETRTFHLYNDSISYIFRVMENDQLEHLYYGRKISDEQSYDIYHEETMRALMSVCVPEPGLLSMQYTKQEYPVYGTGDYRRSQPRYFDSAEKWKQSDEFHICLL